MKFYLQLIFFLFLVLWGTRAYLLSHQLDTFVTEQAVVDHESFLTDRTRYVGQQIRMQGVVRNSYYVPGLGYYDLVDSKNRRIGISSKGYPPTEGQLIEVVIYVQPLVKLDRPRTLQAEVKVLEVLLSFVPSNQ